MSPLSALAVLLPAFGSAYTNDSESFLDPIWPAHLNINDQIQNAHDAGCSGLCSWNGFSDGYVIGTAPMCESTCENSCTGRACISYLPGNWKDEGKGMWMPDMGDFCDSEPVELAEVLFKDRHDSVRKMFHDLEFIMKGKSCCCATPLPRKNSAVKKEKPTPPGTISCDDWCQDGGFGHGVIIGTAPICEATCSNSCGDTACSFANNFFSDYGNGCATGDKVCCCAKPVPPFRGSVANWANAWKYSADYFDPPTKLATPFSCAELCDSGGFGGGSVSGTAPICEGSCADCNGGKCFAAGAGDVTDYGSGCWSGNKVCCCNSNVGNSSSGSSSSSSSSIISSEITV